MFVVIERDDDGLIHEVHGPGTREEAVNAIRRLVEDHIGADNKDGGSGYLDDEELEDLMEGLESEVNIEDGWSFVITDMKPFVCETPNKGV